MSQRHDIKRQCSLRHLSTGCDLQKAVQMCCRCRSLALAPNASLPARANATNAPAPITIIAVRCRVGQLSSHRRTLSFGNRPCPTSKTAADRRRPKLSDCTSLVALCRHRCDSSSSHFFFFFFSSCVDGHVEPLAYVYFSLALTSPGVCSSRILGAITVSYNRARHYFPTHHL
ncbi:uncharacterized protein BKA78DRAFT_43545 [Phyllosticta capitalensis]|uniref:uncharacterized protein n=1 Tax=Phyllosticta capitalensis TaxID=121624 RepID=UPI00312F1B2F